MAIRVELANDVLYLIYIGRWDWDQHHAAIESAAQLTAEVGHPVDVIVDLSQAEFSPANAIRNMGRTLTAKHPRWTKRAYVVRRSMVTDFMLETILRTYSYVAYDHEFFLVHSLEEAHALRARNQVTS